jgi:ABC-type hemin transport system ATPase subunit
MFQSGGEGEWHGRLARKLRQMDAPTKLNQYQLLDNDESSLVSKEV